MRTTLALLLAMLFLSSAMGQEQASLQVGLLAKPAAGIDKLALSTRAFYLGKFTNGLKH